MHTVSYEPELGSLQAIRKMVAQHLAGSAASTGAILDTISRHEVSRTATSGHATYWTVQGSNMLLCRASVFEEIALLRGRLNLEPAEVSQPD